MKTKEPWLTEDRKAIDQVKGLRVPLRKCLMCGATLWIYAHKEKAMFIFDSSCNCTGRSNERFQNRDLRWSSARAFRSQPTGNKETQFGFVVPKSEWCDPSLHQWVHMPKSPSGRLSQWLDQRDDAKTAAQ